jgi:hypothetical protein
MASGGHGAVYAHEGPWLFGLAKVPSDLANPITKLKA